MSSGSTMATRRPWSAARPAAFSPAGPAPSTTTSNSLSATCSPRGRRHDAAPGTEDLRDRPGLEGTAGRVVRRGAVGGLRDRAQAPVREMADEAVDDIGRCADGESGVDVRPDEPGPHRPLVVA